MVAGNFGSMGGVTSTRNTGGRLEGEMEGGEELNSFVADQKRREAWLNIDNAFF